jgi:hypothetical protein
LQQRTDLLEPLLELYHLVSEWERFAEATNSKLAAWAHARTPEERSDAVIELVSASHLQMPRAYDAAWRIGMRGTDSGDAVEHRDKLELRDLIAIYAPDLENQFSHVMRLRVEQLQHLQDLANLHDPTVGAEVGLQQALWVWSENYLLKGDIAEDTEQLLQDFERSGKELSELRREIASFISTHWDPKDVTL